jgi:D-sedoheptulose 7-phosphate isomerase
MRWNSTWQKSLLEHHVLIEKLDLILAHQLDPAVSMLQFALEAGNKILLCGNGGSACDAMHLAAELVVRFVADRKAYGAIALTADSAVLTACGNDYGYTKVFSRQVEALGVAGDVLIALSTSGKSQNVLEAVARAKFQGMPTLGIAGKAGLGCDVDIAIPSTVTARIQEATILCGHLIIEGLEERLPK